MESPFKVGATSTSSTFNLNISSTVYQVQSMAHPRGRAERRSWGSARGRSPGRATTSSFPP